MAESWLLVNGAKGCGGFQSAVSISRVPRKHVKGGAVGGEGKENGGKPGSRL